MKKMIVVFAIAVTMIGFTISAQAQVGKSLLNCDGSASNWITGQAEPLNKFVLTDDNDNFKEGTGALKVDVALRVMPFSWGVWTDAQYPFSTPQDISGADDIRFKMKFINKPSTLIANKPPSYSRAIQFTFDLFDSSASPAGVETWRYQEDLDIFYTARRFANLADSLDGWFDVVIPIKALRMPTWATSINGTLDLDRIKTIAFGVHGDSTASDSVTFLIDDIRATKATVVGSGPLLNFDGTASLWATGQAVPTNKFVLSDYADDAAPGSSQSLKVDVALRTMVASWGVWTDAQYPFAAPKDISGATELRFWIQVLTPPTKKKGVQFSMDITDSTEGGVEFFRWTPGGVYGLFNRKNDWPTNAWFPVVIPLGDMTTPGWATHVNGVPDLNSIIKIAFGVHNDSTASDSITFLIDELVATKAGDLNTGVRRDDQQSSIRGFELAQNYPNPFNPSTTIKYSLEKSGTVSLRIFNLLGQEVKTILSEIGQNAGSYSVDVDMSGLSSGVYMYQLRQGNAQIVKKMMLMQ